MLGPTAHASVARPGKKGAHCTLLRRAGRTQRGTAGTYLPTQCYPCCILLRVVIEGGKKGSRGQHWECLLPEIEGVGELPHGPGAEGEGQEDFRQQRHKGLPLWTGAMLVHGCRNEQHQCRVQGAPPQQHVSHCSRQKRTEPGRDEGAEGQSDGRERVREGRTRSAARCSMWAPAHGHPALAWRLMRPRHSHRGAGEGTAIRK